ncbi:MAG: hypothetical protein ACLFVJ_14765 [Persicimonas sp.]
MRHSLLLVFLFVGLAAAACTETGDEPGPGRTADASADADAGPDADIGPDADAGGDADPAD